MVSKKFCPILYGNLLYHQRARLLEHMVTLFFSPDRQDVIEKQNSKGQNRDCRQASPAYPVEREGEKVPQETHGKEATATECQQH